ncbi:MAG: YdeI/OmpD-associated family protein [Candidatus Micrarchaeota archaeon]
MFSAKIYKLGINPCVNLPEKALGRIFVQAGRRSGPIPVRGRINGKPFRQTLVRYRGAWRLYLNTKMRKDAGVEAGDEAGIFIEFDPEPRIVPERPEFARALSANRKAEEAFGKLPPSHQKEILRYLNSLKNPETVARNVAKVVSYLAGGKPKGLRAIESRKS